MPIAQLALQLALVALMMAFWARGVARATVAGKPLVALFAAIVPVIGLLIGLGLIKVRRLGHQS